MIPQDISVLQILAALIVWSKITKTCILISIHPNPTDGFLKVVIANKISQVDYKIFNNLGQLLKEEKNIDKETNLDLSDLSNGTYFIRFETEQGFLSHQFILKK